MFYRFNAHKQARAGDGQGKDKHAAMDKAARRIASGILKVQRRWAELMRKWTGKLPGKWLRILTIVSFCAASYFFLSLIVPRLGLPVHFPQDGLPSPNSAVVSRTDAAGGSGDSLRKHQPLEKSAESKH
jgi:hypothetical protein